MGWWGGSGGGGGTAGAPLAYTAYHAATDGNTYTTTSTTLVAVDATNLSVVFTAPASGKVLVRLSGGCFNSANTFNQSWQPMESSAGIGQPARITSLALDAYLSAAFILTGVSSGSHTYLWGWYTGAGTATLYSGPSYGDLVMEIWEA